MPTPPPFDPAKHPRDGAGHFAGKGDADTSPDNARPEPAAHKRRHAVQPVGLERRRGIGVRGGYKPHGD